MKKILYSFLLFMAFTLPMAMKSIGQCSVPSGTVGVTPATYGYTIVEAGTTSTFTLTPDMTATGATLYVNGGFNGAGVPNGAGGYTWTPTLTPGAMVTFYFLFNVGGQQQTKTYTYTVGSCGGVVISSPTATITSPANNTTYLAPATIIINADATAPAGSVITRVDFFANNGTSNIFIGTSTAAPYTFTWTNVPAGNYIILALATDDSARTGSSASVHVSVTSQASNGYCGTGTTNVTGDPDYEWKAETVGDSVTMTFHPVGRAVGCDLAIWNSNLGGFGMNLQPNGDLTKTVAYGGNTLITFYFTYRLGAGGPETNTSAGPHMYTIGNDCTIMPVTLADYSAKQLMNGSVAVTWTTFTEINSKLFTIEASFDGRSFSKIGSVDAKGISNDKQYYSFIDKAYTGGTKYYRLSQMDRDGKTTYYGIKLVESPIGGVEQIFPNPMKTSTFYIRTKAASKESMNVQVAAMSGKVIYSGNVMPDGNLLKVTLPAKPAAGIYMVKVGTGNFRLLVQ